MKRLSALAVLLLLCAFPVSSHASRMAQHKLHWLTSAAATVGIFADSSTFTQGTANQRDTSAWVLVDMAPPPAGTVTTDSTLWLRVTVAALASPSVAVSADSMYAYIQAAGPGMAPIGPNTVALVSAADSGLGADDLAADQTLCKNWVWSISWGRILAAAGAADYRCPTALRVIIRGDASAANTGQFEGWLEYLTDNPNPPRGR